MPPPTPPRPSPSSSTSPPQRPGWRALPARIRLPALAGILAGLSVSFGVALSAASSYQEGVIREELSLKRAAMALADGAGAERMVREGYLQGAGWFVDGQLRGLGATQEVLSALAESCLTLPVPADVRLTGPVEIGGERWAGACLPIEGGAAVVADPAHRQVEALLLRALAPALAVGSLSAALVIASVRRVVTPMGEFSQAARRLARGERGVRVAPPEEPELTPLSEAINQLGVALEEREDEILERLELTRQIGALVAHEVRNPLHSLTLLADVACHEEDARQRQELLRSIQRELLLIEEVVRRLVSSGGELHLVQRELELVELIERIFQLQGPRARELQVGFRRLGEPRALLKADPALLRRAIENLVQNAVEICGQQGGGSVEVSLTRAPEGWEICVDDSGPGVPEADRERIFEAGVSRRVGGTGLGLHLVRRVALAHGGSVSCQGSPAGGARFRLVLPTE